MEKKSEPPAFAPIGSFIDTAAHGLDHETSFDRTTLLANTIATSYFLPSSSSTVGSSYSSVCLPVITVEVFENEQEAWKSPNHFLQALKTEDSREECILSGDLIPV